MAHTYSGVFNDIQSAAGTIGGNNFNIDIPVFTEGQLTGDITGSNIGVYTQKNTLHVFSGLSSTSLGTASWESGGWSDPLTAIAIRNLTVNGYITNVTYSAGAGSLVHTITLSASGLNITWVCYTTLFVSYGSV